ncbi:hypothetical protein U1Q18_031151, partial [Sarracenia purpurea var. burkii]
WKSVNSFRTMKLLPLWISDITRSTSFAVMSEPSVSRITSSLEVEIFPSPLASNLLKTGSTSFLSPGDVSRGSPECFAIDEKGSSVSSERLRRTKGEFGTNVFAVRPRDHAVRSRFDSTEQDPLLDMRFSSAPWGKKTDLGLIWKIGLFCSCFVLRPLRQSLPGTVDRAVVTSDANDGGAGVRALKAFFEMNGFTSVADTARISLAVLAGTTRR